MGSVLRDRYEVLDVLGRGGQGEVVRAFDRVHNRLVAVKIRTQGAQEEREVLLGEAGILLGVRPHRLLPLVREDFFVGERYCVVMDWVEGTNLQVQLAERGNPGLPLDDVLESLGQVATALDHLHGHDPPVVHGDVKPSNVVRTADGRAVLVDFGIACRGEHPGDRVYGTTGYLAPEVVHGGALTPAADVFALAATAFALLTGRPPCSGVSPRWGKIAGERAKAVEQTLRQGLAFDCTRRPPTAGALVEGLRGRLRVPTNLPLEPTSFTGRVDELAVARSLLATTRLLTLVGTGGVGKSHLSRHLAAERLADHPDGVYLVELAPLSDPGLVAEELRAALGLSADPWRAVTDALVDHLMNRRLLLVVDNCEHLIGSCAALLEMLLAACPHLCVLATSREPLRLPGETVWRVPSMSGPDAAELFVTRAAAASPGLVRNGRDGPTLERICRRLDGIPLALELAAARTTTLSLQELDRCLDDRFSLLTAGSRTAPPRHRTLRAAIDWTHDSLPTPEQALFRRLSVFAGGFTIDAAAEVVTDAGETRSTLAERLATLVDKSLVVADGLVETDSWARAVRYRLLETLRQYAAERLEGSGEEAAVRARHLDWARSLAKRGDAGLGGREQGSWLEVLEAEHDNLRAALAWAPELRLTADLSRFWELHGHLAEGRRWLHLSLEADEGRSPPAVRSAALHGAGVLAFRQGDYGEARPLHQESLSIRRRLGDRRGVAACLVGLGNLATSEGDNRGAATLFEEALTLGRELGDRKVIAAAAANLGWLASMRWDPDRAIGLLEESLDLRRQLEDRHGAAAVSTVLGHLRRNRGEYGAARSLHEESLAIQRELGDRHGAAWSLTHLGLAAQMEGDDAVARPRHEEALTIRREIGDRHGAAWSLLHLGEVALALGDPAAAGPLVAESLVAARSLKDPWCTTKGLTSGGRVARATGDLDLAAARLEEALALAAEHGFALAVATCLQELGGLAGARGDFLRAARLLGAADARRRAIGGVVHPREAPGYEQDRAVAEAGLASEAFSEAFAHGATMTDEELASSSPAGGEDEPVRSW